MFWRKSACDNKIKKTPSCDTHESFWFLSEPAEVGEKKLQELNQTLANYTFNIIIDSFALICFYKCSLAKISLANMICTLQ